MLYVSEHGYWVANLEATGSEQEDDMIVFWWGLEDEELEEKKRSRGPFRGRVMS